MTSALYAPDTHAVHTVDVVAAGTLLYAPAVQPVHAAVPVVSELYAPAEQAVQTADVLAAPTVL